MLVKKIKNWYFHLWSESLIIELSHGTIGFFDSTAYTHGTLSGEANKSSNLSTSPDWCIKSEYEKTFRFSMN